MARNTFTGQPEAIDIKDQMEHFGTRVSAEMELRFDGHRAVSDAKIAGMRDTLDAKLDGKPGHGALIGHTVAIVALLGSLFVGILAFGGDRFDGGMSATGAFSTQLEAQSARDRIQEEKLDVILKKLEDMEDSGQSKERPR